MPTPASGISRSTDPVPRNPDSDARRRAFFVTIHRNRVVVYNFCLLLAAITKLSGGLDVAWSQILLFILAINLAILPIGLVFSRGRVDLFGVPLMWVSMALDIVFITAGIYLTGGSQSAWYTWYLANAAAAGLVAGRGAMVAVMVVNAAAYLGLLAGTEQLSSAALGAAVERLAMIYGPAFFAFLAVAEIRKRKRQISRLRAEETERARQLEESERRYRQLFEDAAVGYLVVEPDGVTIVDLNSAAANLLDLSKELAPGRSGEELKLVWLSEVIAKASLESATGIAPTAVKHIRRTGDTLELEVTSQRLTVADRGLVLTTILDVSARKRLEEERARTSHLEALGTLAGGLAHDFNNALAAVLGSVSLARLETGNEGVVATELAAAEAGLMRTTQLTSRLLSFASGGKPVKTVVDIGSLIQESAHHASSGAPPRCTLSLGDRLWAAEADRAQLAQVLENVLINARQASPSGGTVVVSAENCDVIESSGIPLAPGPYVRIEVKDAGAGIPTDVRERVFDPYFTTKKDGTGLGLTIAHTIVRNHQGHISVDSAAGVGTTVSVYLPARREHVIPIDTPPPDAQACSGLSILIMDDESSVRGILVRLVEALGNRAVSAADGAEAVRMYLEARECGTPFDGLIMDLTVPGGMGGKDAIAELRRQDPSVRAIVASGYCTDPVLAEFRAHGFCGALCKPFTLAELRREIGGLRVEDNEVEGQVHRV